MRKRFTKNSGFSLVEVTIALGLVTFVLVALLGLFGVGMEASKGSMNSTALGQVLAHASLIKERVVPSEIEGEPDKVYLLAPGDDPLIVYYNRDGSLFAPGQDMEEADYTHAYKVTISAVSPSASGPPSGYFSLLKMDVEWQGGKTTAFSSVVY